MISSIINLLQTGAFLWLLYETGRLHDRISVLEQSATRPLHIDVGEGVDVYLDGKKVERQ
jgi:hypothetical protein